MILLNIISIIGAIITVWSCLVTFKLKKQTKSIVKKFCLVLKKQNEGFGATLFNNIDERKKEQENSINEILKIVEK